MGVDRGAGGKKWVGGGEGGDEVFQAVQVDGAVGVGTTTSGTGAMNKGGDCLFWMEAGGELGEGIG